MLDILRVRSIEINALKWFYSNQYWISPTIVWRLTDKIFCNGILILLALRACW